MHIGGPPHPRNPICGWKILFSIPSCLIQQMQNPGILRADWGYRVFIKKKICVWVDPYSSNRAVQGPTVLLSPFTKEETEVQQGDISYPQPQGSWVAVLELKLSPLSFQELNHWILLLPKTESKDPETKGLRHLCIKQKAANKRTKLVGSIQKF